MYRHEKDTRVGAVITFKPGVDREEVKRLLVHLMDATDCITIQEFDLTLGELAFYQP